MRTERYYTCESELKSWYLEDELSGIEQPKIEDVLNICNILKLSFNKRNVSALIYGDNADLPERVLPVWISQLPE